MEQSTFQLLLNSKQFPIPSQFDRLPKVSSKVYHSLVFDSLHQYYVESNVSEDVFQSFLDYWIKEEVPNISINNFYEYYNLSQEFNLLTDIIRKKKEEFGSDLQFFNGLKEQDKNNCRSDYERQISENLDNYLDQYGTEMMKLPIQTLFNIFNHSQRNFTKHDLAYNLIKIEYKLSNDPNIFILLSALDATKLSQENLEDCLCSRHLRNGMMPKIESSYFANLYEKQRQMESEIEEFRSILNGQQSDMIQFRTNITLYVTNQDKKIDELIIQLKEQERKSSTEIEELKKKIQGQSNEALKSSTEIEELKKQIQGQSNEMLKSNNEIINIKNFISNQANEIKTSNESFSNAFIELKNRIKMQNDLLQKLEESHKAEIITFSRDLTRKMDSTNKLVDFLNNKFMLFLSTSNSNNEHRKIHRRRIEQTGDDQSNPNIKPGESVPKINISGIPSSSINEETSSENGEQNSSPPNEKRRKHKKHAYNEYYSPRLSQQQTLSYSQIKGNNPNVLSPTSRNSSNEEENGNMYSNYNEYYSPRFSQQKNNITQSSNLSYLAAQKSPNNSSRTLVGKLQVSDSDSMNTDDNQINNQKCANNDSQQKYSNYSPSFYLNHIKMANSSPGMNSPKNLSDISSNNPGLISPNAIYDKDQYDY